MTHPGLTGESWAQLLTQHRRTGTLGQNLPILPRSAATSPGLGVGDENPDLFWVGGADGEHEPEG